MARAGTAAPCLLGDGPTRMLNFAGALSTGVLSVWRGAVTGVGGGDAAGAAQLRGGCRAGRLPAGRWGIGGIVGSFGSGWLTDRFGASRTLRLAIGLLILTLAGLTIATSYVAVLAVMLLNGAAGWAMATPNNHRLTALVPALPAVVIWFNSSRLYLGQAIGAALGGVLLTHDVTARALCWTGVGIALAAVPVHALAVRSEHGAIR